MHKGTSTRSVLEQASHIYYTRFVVYIDALNCTYRISHLHRNLTSFKLHKNCTCNRTYTSAVKLDNILDFVDDQPTVEQIAGSVYKYFHDILLSAADNVSGTTGKIYRDPKN